MEPTDLRFGGGLSTTLLHPLVAVAMVLAIILIWCLPRKYVIAPLLLTIFLTPRGQVLVLAGVHFTVARVLIVAALVRWAMSGRSRSLTGGFNSIDRIVALLAVSSLVVFSLQWMQSQAFVKGLGDLLDAMGGYFVMRFLVRNREDIARSINVLAIVAIATAPFMLYEQIAHRNVFGLLGGVASEPALRGEQIRSQGAFEVYITAGVFGASLIPLCVWLWTSGESKLIGALGAISATVMTTTSHSSTPLLAYAFALLALCFWPLRRSMRTFRWTIAVILLTLHLVMKAPVWALIARVDLTGSSSGYHRSQLVDMCIRHFWDWWLLGVKSYDAWGFDMWDLSNQYVQYALTGGLVCLILFVRLISCCFSRLGSARKQAGGDRGEQWFIWCLGAVLTSHVVAYFGISYFDQMQFAWYTFLAIVCVATYDISARTLPTPTLIHQWPKDEHLYDTEALHNDEYLSISQRCDQNTGFRDTSASTSKHRTSSSQ